MPRLIKKISKKAGLPPGTLLHIGEKKIEKAKITLFDYDRDHFQEKQMINIEESLPLKDKSTVTWINIDGIHETNLIEKIGKHFYIHPLTLEDIVNTGHRPKVEDFGTYLFVVMKMLEYDVSKNRVKSEQVSIVLGDHYLISFQEMAGDVFNGVRDRIRKEKGRIRMAGCDYLAYALIDAIVDHYYIILETLEEKIETLEEELISNPSPETLQEIHVMKRETIFFRRQVWPLREVLSRLGKGESSLITETTILYLRDIYDHTIHVSDAIESYRDALSGMIDLYLSKVGHKMNEIMKALTIIATIFIPLSFVAGIYGMNFKYMPELEWRWGYLMAWLLMIGIFISMLFYLKKKKWL